MMSVIIKDMEMPRFCGECRFCRPKAPYPCFCYAEGMPIKPRETDLRDGMCPLEKGAKTMIEYINRYEAIRAFCEDCIEYKTCRRDDDLCDDLRPIVQFPAADVRGNVHGKWIYKEDENVFICSKCGDAMVRNTYFYCPWCGADMRGENNE